MNTRTIKPVALTDSQAAKLLNIPEADFQKLAERWEEDMDAPSPFMLAGHKRWLDSSLVKWLEEIASNAIEEKCERIDDK